MVRLPRHLRPAVLPTGIAGAARNSGYTPGGVLFLEEMARLKAGDPLRAPTFVQLV